MLRVDEPAVMIAVYVQVRDRAFLPLVLVSKHQHAVAMRQRALIIGGLAIGEVERTERAEERTGGNRLDAWRKLVGLGQRSGRGRKADKTAPRQGSRPEAHQRGQRLLGEGLEFLPAIRVRIQPPQ